MSDDEAVPEGKRDVTKEKTYKRNIVREARVTGAGYVPPYTGVQVPQKTKLENLICNSYLIRPNSYINQISRRNWLAHQSFHLFTH